MKKRLFSILLLVPVLSGAQIHFTMVDPASGSLTVTNYGTGDVDISDYRLCSLFEYTFGGLTDPDVTIVSGDFVLSMNESVTFTWDASSGFDTGASDMGLYLPAGSFNDPAAMVAFMEYGAGEQGREPEAVLAGLWEFNTFVTGSGPFIYIGDGTQYGAQYWQTFVPPTTTLVINEVDSDTPSTDMAEFIELYGEPGESLDGLVVVYYNGSNDLSYNAIDLDGYSLDGNGFFVLGNAAVPNVDLVLPNDQLQNGADAVAVYFGDAVDFPNTTPLTLSGLVDAVVYDSSDPDDTGLLPLILAGGQVNEDANGDVVNESIARVPDGGEQLNTSTYVAQLPTPGETNILTLCDGGFVLTDEGSSQETVCLDLDPNVIGFAHMTTEPGSNYDYIITDINNNIVLYPGADEFDFNSLTAGTYRVHGFSFYGSIDMTTVEQGDLLEEILVSGDCIDFSQTFITVIVQVCNIGEGCAELFFSEYLEGEGNNKALEIFNPTNLPVDLSEYFVYTYSNGSTEPSNVFGFTATLDPGETFVISNSSADPELQALADGLSNVTLFNGNDAIALLHEDEIIDVIGVIGEDPGSEWIVSGGSTQDHNLVRKPDVAAPTTDWVLSSSQWNVFDPDDFSHLGEHGFVSCFSSVPVVSFEPEILTVEEDEGTVDVLINVYNPLYEVSVTVSVAGGTATEGVDYSDNLPAVVTFPAGSTEPQVVTITLIDDTEEETAIEDIQLVFTGDDNLMDFIDTTISVYILPNDWAFPLYDIETIAATNGSGIADSLGVDVEVRGVVHGINFNSAGLWFTLIDQTDGILIFNTLEDFGYSVQEGDSVHVQGFVFQFMGQQQIIAHDVTFISAGNEVEEPLTITDLNEVHESHVIRIECVTLSDPLEWNNTSAGFLVTVTDGDEDFGLFIDGDSEMYGSDAPDGHFTVVGIGHQVDPTDPFTGGYQIMPGAWSDFSDFVIASFEDPGVLQFGDEDDVTINFVNTSSGGEDYLWEFGDGDVSTDENPTHTYDLAFLEANNTVTVSLTITSGTCSDTFTMELNTDYVGIANNDAVEFRLFPNPANDYFEIVSTESIRAVNIMDATGRLVLTINNPGGKRMTINVSDLATGMYQVRIETEAGNSSQGLVVH